MTGKIYSKARIVKCPRCRRVLPEPPDVPVYECGGCGTRLQAKKRNNSTVDTTSQRRDEDSSGKQKAYQVVVDQEAGSSSNQQFVLNSADDSDQNSGQNDLHSSNKDQDAAANRAENDTVDAPPSVVQEHSSEKLKMKQLSDDQELGCTSNQQSLVNSSDEPDQNIHNDPDSLTEFSGHEDPESSLEATAHNKIDQEQEQEQMQKQDQSRHQENVAAVGKQKSKQLSDGNEPDSSLTQQMLDNTTNELNRNNDSNEHHSSSKLSYNRENNDSNEHQSSSELSYNHDQELSPETADNNRVKRNETEFFVSCRNETEIEDNSSEFEKAIETTRITSDSDAGSKSSFRTMIAEKLLDTRQKKPAYLDEDDLLCENESADLHHRRRFDRISSVESMKTTRYGATNHYEYEGSVSSFDGIENQNPRKHRTGSIGAQHAGSGNRYRFNRRNYAHRSMDARSFYGLNELNENPRHRSPMIPENPKLESIELLKLVRELQDQLERTNVSSVQQVPSYGQRMAFSGEATAANRRRYGSACHHFSAQIPGHHDCCNGPSYGSNYGPSYGPKSYNSPVFSSPSSPGRNHSESDFSASDDHWQRNGIRRPYCSPRKKQYVRPIAGGGPWIACYLCSKLLQLPQSFLVFNKRYYSLRCGACLKVLKFTLLNGTRVSRYYPEEMIAAPPSSEAEDFDKLAGSWAEPVSCSDRSFENSYSTETDRNGSREFSEERRKATMSRDASGSTRPPSSKVSDRRTTRSEIKEVEPGHNGSPLHWLMGYASPSKVIHG